MKKFWCYFGIVSSCAFGVVGLFFVFHPPISVLGILMIGGAIYEVSRNLDVLATLNKKEPPDGGQAIQR